jgi:hypothetical protein
MSRTTGGVEALSRTHRKVGIAFGALALAIPALAFGASTHFVASKPCCGFEAQYRNGKVSKIKGFGWDGLKCGSDVFTAGLDDPIKVKKERFSDKQSVGGVDVSLTAKVQGRFVKHETKVKGTLKITGACETPEVDWSARAE